MADRKPGFKQKTIGLNMSSFAVSLKDAVCCRTNLKSLWCLDGVSSVSQKSERIETR